MFSTIVGYWRIRELATNTCVRVYVQAQVGNIKLWFEINAQTLVAKWLIISVNCRDEPCRVGVIPFVTWEHFPPTHYFTAVDIKFIILLPPRTHNIVVFKAPFRKLNTLASIAYLTFRSTSCMPSGCWPHCIPHLSLIWEYGCLRGPLMRQLMHKTTFRIIATYKYWNITHCN